MEAETPGDTRVDAQAFVDTVADSLAEMEAKLAVSLPEVEGETLIDTLSLAQPLVDTLADFLADERAQALTTH